MEALSQQPGSDVLPHWVYRELLSPNARTNSLYGVCICTVLLLFGTQAGVERRTGMGRTCRAAPLGRGYLRRRRQGAAWLLTILLSAGVWGVQLLQLWRSYGSLPYLEAPARSLSFLEDLPWGISVLGLWLCLTLARTVLLGIWSSATLWGTEKLGKGG